VSEVFYGRWSVRVLDSHFPQQQRFEISGSDAGDGFYFGTPDLTVSVSGAEWSLSMSRREGGLWLGSAVRRNAASFTNADGLVVWVGADDSPPGTLELDYDDMILVLTSEDPSLNPGVPWTNRYDFTVPWRIVRLD
jgi:hypothetical protein